MRAAYGVGDRVCDMLAGDGLVYTVVESRPAEGHKAVGWLCTFERVDDAGQAWRRELPEDRLSRPPMTAEEDVEMRAVMREFWRRLVYLGPDALIGVTEIMPLANQMITTIDALRREAAK